MTRKVYADGRTVRIVRPYVLSSFFVLHFGNAPGKGSADYRWDAMVRVTRTAAVRMEHSMRISVRDLMVPVAALAKHTMTIAAARDLMLRWNAAEAYVVDRSGKLLGIVPDYEFLKAELNGIDGSESVMGLLSARVGAVDADADIATVLPKFRESWCGRMPVTEKGRLVGLLMRAEVIRLAAHLRQIASMTEAVADAEIAGPHFEPKRERLTPVRRASKNGRSRGRRVRRLAAS